MRRIIKIFIVTMIFAIMLTVMPTESALAATKVSKCKITITKSNMEYTGSACTPKVKVKYKSKTLKKGKDYTLSYKNNVNAGKATVIVKGKGKYKGSSKKTFTITAKSILGGQVSVSPSSFAYTGAPCEPQVNVRVGGRQLINGKDYFVAYQNNINVGTATATVTGKGNFQGRINCNFAIVNSGPPTVTPESMELKSGERKYIQVQNAGNQRVTFESENMDVATVDRQGEVIGNGNGSTRIKIQIGSYTFYCNVTVTGANAHPGGGESGFSRTGYIGDAVAISPEGILKDVAGPITWTSSDESVAIVKEFPTGKKFAGVDEALSHIDFVGVGTATITASLGDDTETWTVCVKDIDDGYMVSKAGTTKNYGTQQEMPTTGIFASGQEIASILGAPNVGEAEGTVFNHQNGMAYYRDEVNNVSYYMVADVYNNRVFVYKGGSLAEILGKKWDASDAEHTPVVLGQGNTTNNECGYAMNQMNWPSDLAVDAQRGWLYVADTRNNRILVYDDITALTTGCNADHAINWFKEDHSSHLNHIQWPWAVSTDKDGTLIVADTCGGNVLIWNTLPAIWEETEDYYYPDMVLSFNRAATPRTINWTGTQLIIGDENIPDVGAAMRVFNGWPEKASLSENKIAGETTMQGNVSQTVFNDAPGVTLEDFDYIYNNAGYGEAVMINGKLYLYYENNIHVYDDGKLDSANEEPDLRLGTVNARYSEETGYFFCGGGTNCMIYAENTILVSLQQECQIVGFSNIPTVFNAKPDIYFGGAEGFEGDEITAHSNYIVGLDIATDGEVFVASSELDKRISMYSAIPTQSGAAPERIIDFNYLVPSGIAIHNVIENGIETSQKVMMTYSRTHDKIYIWNEYEDALNGELPDRVLANRIGTVWLDGDLTDLDYDGRYTYLNVSRQGNSTTYIYDGIPGKEDEAVAMISQGGQLSVGNGYISTIPEYDDGGNPIEGNRIYFYRLSDLEAASESPATDILTKCGEFTSVNTGGTKYSDNIYYVNGNYEYTYFHATDVAMAADIFAFTDLSCNRVLIWDSVDDALNGEAPKAILGHGSKYYTFHDLFEEGEGDYVVDQIACSTSNTIAMPKTLLYDGNNLWVGEFKFANRVVRFAKQ